MRHQLSVGTSTTLNTGSVDAAQQLNSTMYSKKGSVSPISNLKMQANNLRRSDASAI